MRRLIDNALKHWKDAKRRKPLIVRGARQVGKTYSIKAFGEKHFDNLALVDLEKNPTWHSIFEGDLDSRKIIAELEIVLNARIIPGQTLLFMDEIQSCPRAIVALRYLYEDRPELHVVAAGSLLEFALSDISFPVGRIRFFDMHPMSFAEYLLAIGRDEMADLVLAPPTRQPDTVHDLLLGELRRYFFVGGMPESVSAYAETGSLKESFAVHGEISEAYRQDFSKYAPRVSQQCLDSVFMSTARSVGKQIRYSHLAEGFSIPTIKKSFELLCRAKVLRKVSAASPDGIPLGASASSKIFKATMVDIGLMQHLCGVPVDIEYSKSNLLSIYEGAMADQFVGQEMVLTQGPDLHYWSRRAKSSSAEVDYLMVRQGKIIPVEVKSSTAGRLRSMHLLLKSFPDCPRGYVFSGNPFSELPEQKLIFIPLYHAYSATMNEEESNNH